VNRRSFLSGLVPLAAAAPILRIPEAIASEPRRAPLTVTDLNDRLFVISGGGGNVTVFHSSEGVLLVDGGSPERSGEVLKLIKKRTGSSKVHTLFNTHWHWEQTGSNQRLGRAGTQIIAHENTRLWLTTDVDSKWQQRTFKRLPKEAHPNKTFYTSEKLSFGGEEIEHGHTPTAISTCCSGMPMSWWLGMWCRWALIRYRTTARAAGSEAWRLPPRRWWVCAIRTLA
jgi:hypothetical protein